MSSLSARTLRRRPDLAAARAWRAALPDSAGPHEGRGSAVLLVVAALFLAAVVPIGPQLVSWSAFLPLIVISGVIHRPRQHGVVIVASLGSVLYGGVLAPGVDQEALGTLIAASVVSAVTMWRATARARVGVHGTRGEAVLEELRAALERRGELPPLPVGWTVEGCISSAYGHPFSGDFIVSHHDVEDGRLEVALVDVSGKGLRAASRAVQLSDALDALIGAVPPDDFLACANDYVWRQRWTEGFATAVHLVVDLRTGRFEICRAGHPPAAVFRYGSSAWSVLDEFTGPALGFLERPIYPCTRGSLGEHDAVMLYTDGLVERPGRALDEGIEGLLGRAGGLASGGFDGGSSLLCAQAAAGETDDRAVVILRRA